jgi:hypothetical protein
MKTNEFAQLLQNELILPRDPHLVARFIALLDEYFAEAAPLEPTAQDGVSVDLVQNTVGPIPITDIPPSTYSAPAVVREPTPADGVNVVHQEPLYFNPNASELGVKSFTRDGVEQIPQEPSVADPTLVTEPIPVTDPAPVESLPESTESEAK